MAHFVESDSSRESAGESISGVVLSSCFEVTSTRQPVHVGWTSSAGRRLATSLRWRHARHPVQILSRVVAFRGQGVFSFPIPTDNLAPILIWVHYRGLLVVALLAAGNFFCMGCPFVLVRDAGRRIVPPAFRWPRRFRTKWFGAGLFVLVLFSYEIFDLWALPRATAYLVLAYFGAALLVDLVFSGATFCKYLCPVGQFNFVASTVSPLELRVKEESTCRSRAIASKAGGPSAPQVVVQRLRVGTVSVEGRQHGCTFLSRLRAACPTTSRSPRPPGMELADPRRRAGRLVDGSAGHRVL